MALTVAILNAEAARGAMLCPDYDSDLSGFAKPQLYSYR
jgi:hypothetical protein